MSYEIVGTYRGRTEVLDTTDTLKDAEFLCGEYQLAFGRDWRVIVMHADCDNRGGACNACRHLEGVKP